MTDEFMPPPNSGITPEEWQQTPPRVQTWIRELCAENKQLREAVEELREIVNRNSQNSSQSPSQNRPDQKPTKEPCGPPRKRGGQPGHRGHHRALVDEVDEVIVHKPTRCAECGALLLGDDPAPYRHQVTELPIVKPKVIAHQVHCVDCPCCGQRNRGELPADVAASWFGPNVISLAGLLMGRFRLSKRQMTQALGECFAIPMAASTVVNQQPVISQALAAPVAELEPVVKNEPVCTIDETGWRQVGAPRRCWLWVVVTAQAPPVSHGTQSDPGSRFVARILTVVETCRQQQRPVVDFLREALTAYRAGQPAPSLLPTHQP